MSATVVSASIFGSERSRGLLAAVLTLLAWTSFILVSTPGANASASKA